MKIYLVFTDTKTVLSNVIKTCTNHPYNHVSISFTQDLAEMYSFRINQGFVKETLKMNAFRRAQCAIYTCSVSEGSYLIMRSYVNEVEARQEEFKYNIIGLIHLILKRTYERENAFFCSQFVAAILEKGNVQLSGLKINRTTPKDLAELEALEKIYGGALRTYPHTQSTPHSDQNESILLEA